MIGNQNNNGTKKDQSTPSPKAGNSFNMMQSQRKRTKNTSVLPRSPTLPLQGLKHNGGEVLAKKRLVEQFYMPKSETPLKAQSYSDLVTAFRQGLPVGDSPARELRQDELLQSPEITAREEFVDLARNGKLEYQPIDKEIQLPSKVTEMLLGVDDEEDNNKVLDRVVLTLHSSAQALERRLNTDTTNMDTPKTQLNLLDDYLNGLSEEVNRLHHELSESTHGLKSQFRLQLQVSVEKLEKLDELLKTLSGRLDDCRKRMLSSKEVMTETMADRIAMLEFVAKRFNEHDELVRQRRVAQMTVFLCIVILGVIALTLMKKFR
uniref:Uncharacterized protein n=1 Tax=Candidozyma auris TaxID=498019 RepID=A0A0L0P531_CANAR